MNTKLRPYGPVYLGLIEQLSALSPKYRELCAVLESEYRGRLPIRIWAARENEIYDSENILVRVEAADERFLFVPDLIAPVLIQAVWYPSTVASRAAEYSTVLKAALDKSSTSGTDFSRFMIYGFGQRSSSSQESSIIGGAAVLQFFDFTDILGSREWLNESYPSAKTGTPLKTFSLDHGRYLLFESSIKENPTEFLRSVFESFDIFSLPVDSTSFEELDTTLRATVRDIPPGKSLILRWDGSQFESVIPKLIEILKSAQTPVRNSKGFQEWKPGLFLMFTEDMTVARVKKVLDTVMESGFAVDRVMFGAGTQMLQNVSRDSFGVVGKLTAAFDGERWFDVEKKSSDHPEKRGLAGRLSLRKQNGQWINERAEASEDFRLVYGD